MKQTHAVFVGSGSEPFSYSYVLLSTVECLERLTDIISSLTIQKLCSHASSFCMNHFLQHANSIAVKIIMRACFLTCDS